jgi:hypothetical protein
MDCLWWLAVLCLNGRSPYSEQGNQKEQTEKESFQSRSPTRKTYRSSSPMNQAWLSSSASRQTNLWIQQLFVFLYCAVPDESSALGRCIPPFLLLTVFRKLRLDLE